MLFQMKNQDKILLDFCLGYRNVSHHYHQQSSSGLQSPKQSYSIATCYPQAQTICINNICNL